MITLINKTNDSIIQETLIMEIKLKLYAYKDTIYKQEPSIWIYMCLYICVCIQETMMQDYYSWHLQKMENEGINKKGANTHAIERSVYMTIEIDKQLRTTTLVRNYE